MDVCVTGVGGFRSAVPLKGKTGNRGWARLPPDVVRLVINHLIRDCDALPIPPSWSDAMLWPQRLVFVAVRTSVHIQPLMRVCRPWRSALSNHPFWAHLCASLDPSGQIAQWSKKPMGNSSISSSVRYNHQHSQIVRSYSCIACRIRNPLSTDGFVQLKGFCQTMHTGKIGVCRDHKQDNVCGVCLRSEYSRDEYMDFIVAKSEDDKTFPFIEATCTKCRQEAVCARARLDACLAEAWDKMQGNRGQVDWEIRQSIEQFIEYGDGSIDSLVWTTWEKTWLRSNTKIAEYLDQAVASVRYQNREEGYESEDEISDDDEVLCFQEEAGVKDIAMSDYCRGRILDGYWNLPFDTYVAFSNRQPLQVIPAHNPVPNLFPAKPGEQHPSRRTIEGMPPPTSELASRLSHVFHNEMRQVINPALQNLVRKVVLECARSRTEPSMVAAKMDVEEILQALRTEGVWWDGFDWTVQWEEEERRRRHREEILRRVHQDDDESTNSSRSDCSSASNQTSPVLSTSTLLTTPSPEPIEGRPGQRKNSISSAKAPRTVPFVPESSASMPPYTKDLIRTLWREAAAPLFHCKCNICARAMLAERANAGAMAVGEVVTASQQQDVQQQYQEEEEAMEEDYEDEDLQAALALERELNSHTYTPSFEAPIVPSQKRSPLSSTETVIGRKRSSEELECEKASKAVTYGRRSPPTSFDHSVSTTPSEPKRAKLGDHNISLPPSSDSLSSKEKSMTLSTLVTTRNDRLA